MRFSIQEFFWDLIRTMITIYLWELSKKLERRYYEKKRNGRK